PFCHQGCPLGNLIPDIAYYAIGYWGRERMVGRYGHLVGLSPERLAYFERLFAAHAGKTLVAVKLLPFAATAGLIVAGVVRMPIRRYASLSLAIILPTSLLYLFIGYYFGAVYETLDRYIHFGGIGIVVAVLIFFGLVKLSQKISARLSAKIEKI
ncbi:MAG: VTT domain-containing protein, partial [Patescibacteria group bacterium]